MLDEHEVKVKEWEAANAIESILMESAGKSGQVAMKSAILINGGAAVAMLAFIGHVLSSDLCIDIKLLTKSTAFFTIGVLLGAVATGTTYLTYICYQISYRKHRENKKVSGDKIIKLGSSINIVTIILVISTYILFLKGFCTVYELIINFPK